MYQHNFMLSYPNGYKNTPPLAGNYKDFDALKAATQKPFSDAGVLIFDPWPDLKPGVYPSSKYPITNMGQVNDASQKRSTLDAFLKAFGSIYAPGP